MFQIIDRRLSGKNKSVGNRERFLDRHKDRIREAVKRVIDGRSIKDVAEGTDIRIPRRDMSEPVFQHGQGGIVDRVYPGNEEYAQGDRIDRPRGGQGGGNGSGQASDSGEGEDDFVFHLNRDEFMRLFFDDLALPHLIRTQLADIDEWKTQRAGFTSDGTPNNLHVLRSMRGALGRRIALGADARRELRDLEEQLQALQARPDSTPALAEREMAELQAQIQALRAKLARIPYLDPIDLRFRNRVRVPVPITKAVMFCVMDVSGSMDEDRKNLAKRFFILLYLFLTRHYEKIELVFIRHHTQAQEVDEQNFFHSTETGGTVVSSALVLMEEIVRERYAGGQWNIYGAQASDGDNWGQDSGKCRELLSDQLLPMCRYYAYLQVVEEEQNLWDEYHTLLEGHRNFAMKKATTPDQIYPVFRELFKKEGVQETA